MSEDQQFILQMVEVILTFVSGVLLAYMTYLTLMNAGTIKTIHKNTNSLVKQLVDSAREEGRQAEQDRVTTLASKEDMVRVEDKIDEVPEKVVEEIDRSKTDSEKG